MNPLRSACLAALSLVAMAAGAHVQTATPDLVGLWEAKGRFGPDVAGRLVVDRPAGALMIADLIPRHVLPAVVEDRR